ncbi:MAG: diacylglycerol kinase, partial [Thermodesulfobacteriota bacterium]
MGKKDFHPKNSFESLVCAVKGVVYAVKTQKHIRYHIALTTLALILGITLNLPALEFTLLIFSFITLIFA